ncbi:MAG: MFS transporter [Novosphingobium sp.]
MTEANPLRAHARVLIASTVGTAVEYYDFFIYATAAALVFGPLFFPAYDPAAQTLLAFVTFGVAFVARPIGAVAFGHFGDRIGRKSTLVASLLLMGASTLGIAFLPTYATAGWVAPALLCLMRFGQGFGLGGEWAGAALLAVENAPKGWAARFGAAPQLGVPLGFAAANSVFLLLGLVMAKADFAAWGWRIPFLISAVLVAIGLWIRLKISETPAFQAAIEREAPPPVPMGRLLKDHPGAVLAGSAGVVSTYTLFYLATAFALAQGAGPLGYPREAFIGVQLIANLFLTFGILAASTLADRTSPGRVLAIGSVGTALVGFVFSAGLAAGMAWAAVMLSGALFVMAFTNAPLGSWLSSLFPTRVRYSGVAFAFNFGGVLGGAVTPILAQALSTAHLAHLAGLLIVGSGLISLVGVLLARPVASGSAAA